MQPKIINLMPLVLLAACAPPVPPASVAVLRTAFTVALNEVDAIAAPEVAAQLKAHQQDRIRIGEPVYALTAGCNIKNLEVKASPDATRAPSNYECNLTPVTHKDRQLSQPEKIAQVAQLLRGYIDNLHALASATSPDEAAAAATGIIGELTALHVAANKGAAPTGWLFRNAGGVTSALRFGLEQWRARQIRAAVKAARQPVFEAIVTLLEYLRNEGAGRDPLVPAAIALNAAFVASTADPKNAARITTLEASHAAYVAARATSPAYKLAGVLAAHEALANRLEGPATIGEITALIKELAALRDLALAD